MSPICARRRNDETQNRHRRLYRRYWVGIEPAEDERNLQGSANTRWISTLAARFGVVLNNGVLLYGKAGGGWVDNNATITNLNTGASISASNRNSGWVVGAGVEWAIAGNWSAKLEYDFVKLDDLTFGPGPFLGNTFTASREIQMFKVGLNYRFGSLFGGGYGGSY